MLAAGFIACSGWLPHPSHVCGGFAQSGVGIHSGAAPRHLVTSRLVSRGVEAPASVRCARFRRSRSQNASRLELGRNAPPGLNPLVRPQLSRQDRCLEPERVDVRSREKERTHVGGRFVLPRSRDALGRGSTRTLCRQTTGSKHKSHVNDPRPALRKAERCRWSE